MPITSRPASSSSATQPGWRQLRSKEEAKPCTRRTGRSAIGPIFSLQYVGGGMARRIDVELTSARDDGTWTWRAAGAKQPKGVLDAALLFEGAKVGDLVRAEAEFEIDGITITSILPPREKKRSETERIEVRGEERAQGLVTSSLVARSDRPRPRDRDRDRAPRPDGGRPPRTERRGDRGDGPERARPDRARGERSERRPAGDQRETAPPARAAGPGPRP